MESETFSFFDTSREKEYETDFEKFQDIAFTKGWKQGITIKQKLEDANYGPIFLLFKKRQLEEIKKKLPNLFSWLVYKIKTKNSKPFHFTSLGRCYATGFGIKEDKELSLFYFHLGMEKGDVGASVEIASHFLLDNNQAKGFEMYYELYKRGFFFVTVRLGECYMEGIGVQKNEKLGFDFTKLANDKGFSITNLLLGYYYMAGKGVEKNEKLAFDFMKLAADQDGNSKAKLILANYYMEGKGVEKNEKLAFDYYKVLSEEGIQKSTEMMIYCYFTGIGVKKDCGVAFKSLSRLQKNEKTNILFNHVEKRFSVLNHRYNQVTKSFSQCVIQAVIDKKNLEK